MKTKNLKTTLAVVSALALSAQLILPTAIFADSEADTSAPAERPKIAARAEEKDLKDDIIFIGSSDTGKDADKTLIKCISFGMHGGGGRKFGNFDKEPPEKPDNENDLRQPTDNEPPEKPDAGTKERLEPDSEPPAKPENDGETMQKPDGEPPEGPGNEKNMGTRIEISEGDTISITASDGTVLETVTADKAAKGVVYSSDKLVQNETYTLLINGESAATTELFERGNGENGMNDTQPQKPSGQNFDKSRYDANETNNMSAMNRNSDVRRMQR